MRTINAIDNLVFLQKSMTFLIPFQDGTEAELVGHWQSPETPMLTTMGTDSNVALKVLQSTKYKGLLIMFPTDITLQKFKSIDLL